jgi:hypothetical protein
MREDRHAFDGTLVEGDKQAVQSAEDVEKVRKTVEIAATDVLSELFVLVPFYEPPHGLAKALGRIVDGLREPLTRNVSDEGIARFPEPSSEASS